jgi:hypothetical protein
MDARTVLVDQFVPHALISVNLRTPTAVFPAEAPTVLDAELASILDELVPPPVGFCTCTRTGASVEYHHQQQQQPHRHVWHWPMRRVFPELLFAIEHRTERLKKTTAGDAATDEQAGDVVIAAIHEISDPTSYRQIFETICV